MDEVAFCRICCRQRDLGCDRSEVAHADARLQTAGPSCGCASRYTASILERAGIDPSRIEIVYPGYDAARFRPLKSRPEFRQQLLGERHKDQVISTVGNLVARKGHDLIIRALPKIAAERSQRHIPHCR